MIRRIAFRNFQGFKGEQEVALAPITLIFGQNASGKSSVLRAIRLFKEIYESIDSNEELSKQFASEVFGFKALKFSSALQEPLSISLDFDVDSSRWNLSFQDLPEELESFSTDFNRVRLCYTDDSVEAKFKVAGINKKLPGDAASLNMSFLRPLDKSSDWPWTLRSFDNSEATKVDSERSWINREHPWWTALFGTKPSLRMVEDELSWASDGPNLASLSEYFPQSSVMDENSDDFYNNRFWHKWLRIADAEIRNYELTTVDAVREQPPLITDNPDVLRKQNISLNQKFLARLNESLLRLTGGRYEYRISSMRQSPQSTKQSHRFLVKDHLTGSETSFENVGSGLSHVLPILGALANRESKYIYIEQPEQHLHPIMQAKLAEEFVASITNDSDHEDFNRDPLTRQIIAETHSENLLLGIQKLVRKGLLHPSMVSIIYTEPHESLDGNGFNRIFNIEMNKWGELIDPFPVSFADLRSHYLWDIKE